METRSSYSRRERPEDSDSVEVCVRIRPLNGKEKQEQTKSCIRIPTSIDGLSSSSSGEEAPKQLVVGKDRAFTFDAVLGATSSQEETYRLCVAPLVQCFVEGYNATILAYGQTGTGKTHTMSGSGFDARGEKHEELQGIIPRVVKAIFKQMQEHEKRVSYNLRVEYIEIYNEELRDLLHPETTSKQLSIREDGAGNIIIAGVKSEPAPNKQTVFRQILIGGAARATGSTLMNEQSSRSHAIFSLIMQQRDLATGECRKSKFHLVDLAGSERAKRTGAVAGRFKESVSINQGLLALGNVISALSDEKKRNGTTNGAVHVPYRDSKLTRLLQDSLGGNSKTVMIACVSPATVNFEETLNTLKYANRAKNIKNRPIVNQQEAELEAKQKNDDKMISRMREEIANLQTQLQKTSSTSRPSTAVSVKKESRPSTASNNTSSETGSQELRKAKKALNRVQDVVETMRMNSMEAITSLIAMERDIKPLGRPVQQRLNEIVKVLNASIQLANSSEIGTKSSSSPEQDGDSYSASSGDDQMIHQLTKDLKAAKNDLARDEQIFEMKNAEIKRLQGLLLEAKAKNDTLIQRVQELDRGGQLWSNTGAGTETAPALSPINESKRVDGDESASSGTPKPLDIPLDIHQPGPKTAPSSRGLFTRRAGTAKFDGDDDSVLMDNPDEEQHKKPSLLPRSRAGTSVRSTDRLHSSSGRRGDVSSVSTADMMKLEKTITSLNTKLQELERQNGELMDGREESLRRWELERRTFERQINEHEQMIESLRKANQVLEDAVMEEKQTTTTDSLESKSLRASQRSKIKQPLDLVIEEQESADRLLENKQISGSRPSTDTRPSKSARFQKDILLVYEESIQRLIEYNDARRNVLNILKEKKETQQSRDDAARRMNALEMQKLRQSLSVRESISDVSKSLRLINEKMQVENRTIEEIERLQKLKDRATRKLKALRLQEAKEEFLDQDTQQELIDLEELIEDLNSHISFQDSELAAAREEISMIKKHSHTNDVSPIDDITEALSQQLRPADPQTVQAFIRKCVEDVSRLRAREQELLSKVQEISGTVEEKNASIDQLESGLIAARKEFDRRLDLQQQDCDLLTNQLQQKVAELISEKQQLEAMQQSAQPAENQSRPSLRDDEWQKLIVGSQKKDEYIVDLEKHVVFYKSKAKQMQVQLQQLIRDSSSANNNDESSHEDTRQLQRRIQQLEEANDSLIKDLATAKIYLRSSKTQRSGEGAQVVRISRSELRELPGPLGSSNSSLSHIADI